MTERQWDQQEAERIRDERYRQSFMPVAPGTDAVVWKPWDTSHVECEL